MDQRGHELLWIHRRMMDRVARQASQFSNSVKENGDDLNLHASSASATLLRDQKSNQKKLQPKYSQMKDAAHRPMGNDNAGTEDLEAAVLFDFEGEKNDEQIKDMPPLDSESAPALKTSHGISKRGQNLRGVSNEKEMTKSLHAINNIVHAQPSDRTLHSYNDYNSASETNFSSRKVQELGNTTTYQNFTPPLLQQPPTSNSTTTVGNIKQGDSMLTSIVAMLILTPCLAAAVAQIIFMWKKRARDRIERELAEVSTNPAGRRMILDEIFKGDSRPVTEDEVSPRKKRVLVKKRRKKTPSERNASNANMESPERSDEKVEEGEEITNSSSDDNANKDGAYGPWWEEEEVMPIGKKAGGRGDNEFDLDVENGGRIVICISDDKAFDNGEFVDGINYDEDGSNDHPIGNPPDYNDNHSNTGIDNIGSCGSITNHEEEPLHVNELPSMRTPLRKILFDASHDIIAERGLRPERENTDRAADNVDDDIDNDIVSNEDPDGVLNNGETKSCNDVFCGRGETRDSSTAVISGGVDESDEHHTMGEGFIKDQPNSTINNNAPDQSISPARTLNLAPKIQTHPGETNLEWTGSSQQKHPPEIVLSPQGSVSSNLPIVPITTFTMNDIQPKVVESLKSTSVVPDPDEGNSASTGIISGKVGMDQPHFGLILPNLSNNNDNCASDSCYRETLDEKRDTSSSIFREGKPASEAQGMMEIQASGSSVTEVASNVDELINIISEKPQDCVPSKSISVYTTTDDTGPINVTAAGILPSYRLERTLSGMSNSSGSLSLGNPIPFGNVESYVTDASSISYFSYEDFSIDEEDLEMCAICLCVYEEGDIRIFSKRCTHAFHKECVFEWLVKGHEECPCCRAEMVSKSEIKETSASLIGTERLAQAMAVFNGSGMIEAPPFQARRPRLAAHLLARTRSRGPSGHNMRGPGVDSSASNNAHWLWAARFQDAQPGASSATGQMARVREDAPLSPQRSPHRPTSSTSPNNIHNRDWLWTNRFDSAENPSPTNQSVPISRANGPTSDNANQENQIPPGASDNASGNAAVPNTSMYHDHWTQSRPTRTSTISLSPRRASQPSGPIALSPSGSNRHAYWQQPSGPIALSPSGSTRHAHWQRASQPDHSSSVARHYATILEGTSPANSRDALESETASSPTTRG